MHGFHYMLIRFGGRASDHIDYYFVSLARNRMELRHIRKQTLGDEIKTSLETDVLL